MRRRSAALLGLALVAAFGAGCASSLPTGPGTPAAFDAAVVAAERRCQCRVGVSAKHLESGRTYSHSGTAEFESASVIKIAVLTEAMAGVRDGTIDLAERWELTAQNKADGSGTLFMLDPGLQSDVERPDDADDRPVRQHRRPTPGSRASRSTRSTRGCSRSGSSTSGSSARSPGCRTGTTVPSRWKGFKLGILAPDEVARWMELVATGQLLDAASSKRMFDYLDTDPSRLRIARRFPPSDLWAGKTGSMSGVRNDSGILRTKKGRFVLVVLTDGSKAEGWGPDHPAVLAIADLSKAIVDGWSRDLPDIAEKPE